MHTCAYVLAQYGWFFFVVVFGIAFSLGYSRRVVTKVGTVSSATRVGSFRADENPSVFAHVTDIHVEDKTNVPGTNFDKVLSDIEELGLKSVLVTGDLVDNMEENWVLIHGYQKESDYNEYKKVISKHVAKGLNLIDIAGNHDEFEIGSMFSKSHHVLKFSNFLANTLKPESYDDYLCTKYESQNVEFLVFNPFPYPQPSTLLGEKVRLTVDMLDILERRLAMPCEKPYRVFMMHFSMSYMHDDAKSSSGKTFRELIENANLTVMLAGHVHPNGNKAYHHGGQLEIVGVDLVTHHGWSIVSFDNGVFSDRELKLGEVPKGVITHPASKKMLSKSTVFNKGDMEIRVVMFNRDPNMKIFVKGDIEGEMVFDRFVGETGNLSLYSLPVYVKQGEYHIEFSGDFEDTLDFIVADSVDLPDESYTTREWVYTLFKFMLVCWFLALVVILTPYSVPTFAEELRQWIDGEIEEIERFRDSHWKIWLRVFFLGLFVRKARLKVAPIVTQMTLFLGFLLVLFVPSLIGTCDGHMLIVNIWGYSISGRYRVDPWGASFASLYLTCIISPLTVLLPMLFGKFRKPMIADIIYFTLMSLGGVSTIVFLLYEAGDYYSAFSPLFVMLPALIYGIIGYAVAHHGSITKEPTHETSSVDSQRDVLVSSNSQLF